MRSLRNARLAAEAATWFQRQDRDITAAKKIELDEKTKDEPKVSEGQEGEAADEGSLFARVMAVTEPNAVPRRIALGNKRSRRALLAQIAELEAEIATAPEEPARDDPE
jgi:hypothetical protein